MMFAMFVLWMAVFVGIFLKWRWTVAVVLIALVYTVLILRLHISDPIPLNF